MKMMNLLIADDVGQVKGTDPVETPRPPPGISYPPPSTVYWSYRSISNSLPLPQSSQPPPPSIPPKKPRPFLPSGRSTSRPPP